MHAGNTLRQRGFIGAATVFSVMDKYPLGFVLLICLLFFFAAGIFFNATPLDAIDVQYLLTAGILCSSGRDYLHRVALGLAGGIFFAVYLLAGEIPLILFTAEILMLGSVVIMERHQDNALRFGVIAAAFLLHLFYIQMTDSDVRQHDLSGIMLYMRLITQNGLNWHEFNPWHMYYLFHQPLHFVLAGSLYLAEMQIWNSGIAAIEGLQYLSLFYVTAATIFAAGIYHELGLKGKVFYAVLILFAFNPTLVLFSGYISDDPPIIFWSTMTTYFIIRWYQHEKLSDIVLAALGFGFGTLTKLSMLMMAPALGVLFSCQLLAKRHNRQNLIFGLSLFAIITIPLALAWVLRNHILFDMQFYNIPDTSPSGQNFKYMTLGERLGNFSMLFKPFINAPFSADSNIFLALVKTELFGEWDFSLANRLVYFPAAALYLLNIIIKIMALCGLGLVIFQLAQNRQKANVLLAFFALQYTAIWLYSFKYAMDYPYVCSTDYRLFAQLILPESILLSGLARKGTAGKIFLAVSLLYAMLTATVYLATV